MEGMEESVAGTEGEEDDVWADVFAGSCINRAVN